MESQFGVSRKKRPEAFDAAEAGCPEDDDDEACIPLISLFFFFFFSKCTCREVNLNAINDINVVLDARWLQEPC